MTNLDLEALSSALENEIHSTELLQKTLSDERAALGQMDPDHLQTITALKTGQVSALEKLTQHRMQLSPTVDQPSLIESLNQSTDTAAEHVLTLFSTLLDNGRQLARMNRVNGLTLRQGQNNVQQAITLLTGDNGKQTDLYNATGNRGGSVKKQQLGTA